MIVAIIQARMSSSRLPGKVLKKVKEKTLLEILVTRLSHSRKIDKIVVATSTENSDNAIAELCKAKGIEYFRGSLDNVLDRYYQCALFYQATDVLRITADCPLSDPQLVDQLIKKHEKYKTDYCSNVIKPSFPDGLDVEVLSFSALKRIKKQAELPQSLNM